MIISNGSTNGVHHTTDEAIDQESREMLGEINKIK